MIDQNQISNIIRAEKSKGAYYTESIFSPLHHLSIYGSLPMTVMEHKSGKFPILGMLLMCSGVADAVGRIYGTIKDKPSRQVQESYENSIGKQLLNLIPGVAGYNRAQSDKYYKGTAAKVASTIKKAQSEQVSKALDQELVKLLNNKSKGV